MNNYWWLYLLNTSYLNNNKKLSSSPDSVIITAPNMQYSLIFRFVCTMGSSAVFLGYH